MFIILAVALRKNVIAMILLLLIGLGTLAGGPFIMSLMVDSIVRKSTISNLETKQLNFTKALVVSGNLRNSGKIDLKDCSISVEVWNQSTSKLEEYARLLKKPKFKQEFFVTKSLPKKMSQEFRVVYDNFRVGDNMDVVVKSKCY